MPAILVTGAAKRIGAAIAKRFAAAGFDVAFHYNNSENEAHKTAAEIKALGRKCELLRADLGDLAALEPLIISAKQAFPELSVLINSASVFSGKSFMESEIANYQEQFRLNVEAPIFLTQAFAKHVKQGAVVNMLDAMIHRHKHRYFFYLMSKKTLANFTQMAALELAPNIRVNGVCPGYILPGGDWGEDYQRTLEAKLPLRKTATVAEVAEAVYSLSQNSSLTGQLIFLDGGEFLL